MATFFLLVNAAGIGLEAAFAFIAIQHNAPVAFGIDVGVGAFFFLLAIRLLLIEFRATSHFVIGEK